MKVQEEGGLCYNRVYENDRTTKPTKTTTIKRDLDDTLCRDCLGDERRVWSILNGAWDGRARLDRPSSHYFWGVSTRDELCVYPWATSRLLQGEEELRQDYALCVYRALHEPIYVSGGDSPQ